MGFDLRGVVFTQGLERMKKRAGSLRNMKRFKKCGIHRQCRNPQQGR
jgi:hypothetical protein